MDTYIKFLINPAQFNEGTLCHTENIQWKLHLLPRASQQASADCCGDILDSCPHTFNYYNSASTNLILNTIPQKEV
jgi:hypothetical protein